MNVCHIYLIISICIIELNCIPSMNFVIENDEQVLITTTSKSIADNRWSVNFDTIFITISSVIGGISFLGLLMFLCCACRPLYYALGPPKPPALPPPVVHY